MCLIVSVGLCLLILFNIFQESFVANLLRIIQHMKPKAGCSTENEEPKGEKDQLAVKFPGLALPNDPKFEIIVEEKPKKKKKGNADDDIVSDAMAALAALAPSKQRYVKIIQPPTPPIINFIYTNTNIILLSK